MREGVEVLLVRLLEREREREKERGGVERKEREVIKRTEEREKRKREDWSI